MIVTSTFIPRQNECFWGYTPAKRMFLGIYLNQPVRPSAHPSVHVSVFVQNLSFCQSAGGGIESHLVTAVVSFCDSVCNPSKARFYYSRNINHLDHNVSMMEAAKILSLLKN